MHYETTLFYTLPLMREAVWGFWRRSVGLRFPAVVALLCAMLAWDVFHGDRSWLAGMLGTALAVGIAMMIAIYGVHYANALRKLQDMGVPQATMRVSEPSFTVTSGAGSATLPWSSVMEVHKLNRCWLLLLSKAQFITLPLASVPEDMRTFILQRVVDTGGKVKN